MPDYPSLQNFHRLLHTINFEFSEHNKDELIKLLSQSDVYPGDINLLKNESDHIIAGNLEKNAFLVDKLNKLEEDENKKFRVFRRETPFTSARVAGSVPDWARGAEDIIKCMSLISMASPFILVYFQLLIQLF